ncbi:MAG: HD domain-containing protein [Coriobacteriia bacterium]|nr:HD domain-containing protein [Coriobacteriia bacterium]
MKAKYLTELTLGARTDSVALVRSKEVRVARNGDAYLALELADRTGSMPAVLFRPGPAASEIPVGAVARVTGVVTSYRGIKRLAMDSLVPAATWDSSDLLPVGPRDGDELKSEFVRITKSITQSGLRRLLRAVFVEPGLFDRFCVAPASQSSHHAYVTGLLEHTVAVAGLCSQLAACYEGADHDLLVTAALLHDIGKLDELVAGSGISYTDEGRLLGHVVLGHQRVLKAAQNARLEPAVLLRLGHVMLSHHGELEWGSPKRPATLEALLLHHVDNLDAKAAGLSTILAGATRADETWTDASNLFRRPLHAPRAVEDDRPYRATEDDLEVRRSA